MNSTMPTSLANGRYQLGQLIGRGGMAQVRVALDTRLGRTVAVKIMRADLANDDIFLSRFRREAHAVAQMNNANIVNIFDSGEESIVSENGHSELLPYLIMEYVKGQTLRDILKANGAISQRDAAQVLVGVLSALEYSHRMGVIHRDIKPGNIMISEQGVVKVMDFGIARALDDSAATMTQSQGVVGTAQYLSPEQARGESVDMRSDLYSAGCVLYEALTGKPPFTGDSAVAIAYQHVSEVATPPSVIVPGLPRMWDQICAKAMSKDRQSRYATASEFKNDILALLNGGTPVAASFNPLSDLSDMKARKQAERAALTTATAPLETAATQAFNPLTGQFDQVRADPLSESGTRTEQRQAAQRERRRKQLVIGSLIAGLVLMLAVVVGWVWVAHNGAGEDMVTVPTFTSTTTRDAAEEKLKAAGLNIEVRQDADSTKPEGTFTKQDPQGGDRAARGSTVTVWFSTGPQSVSVPEVKGKTQDEARDVLQDAGFKVSPGTKTENSAKVPKDSVTRTDPASGTSQAKGSTVTLYISSGMTEVPDGLVGQTQDAATNALHEAGFNTSVMQEHSDTVPSGSVTRLDPGPGTLLEQGSSVTVYVSSGKEQVTIPTIAPGMTYAQAKALLEAAGLTVTPANPNVRDSDIVTALTPSSGGTVDKGSTVTVTTRSATTSETTDSPTP